MLIMIIKFQCAIRFIGMVFRGEVWPRFGKHGILRSNSSTTGILMNKPFG